MPLTDAKLRGVEPGPKQKKISDGGQLYLLVKPNGSKLWRMDYAFEGKRKTLSFGAYPQTSLADARALRDWAKKAISAGDDPSDGIRAKKLKVASTALQDAPRAQFSFTNVPLPIKEAFAAEAQKRGLTEKELLYKCLRAGGINIPETTGIDGLRR